ncbi:MAG: hypothetical protein GY938_02610 [Ketobacter sp.]|nr:hypothetical protein [Ketobacter sp.]
MKDDPQRFDIMSITHTVRKKHFYKIRATTAQRNELQEFNEWKNKHSKESQWNLPRGEEPNRMQNYLQEWHVPELGFAGVEKQAKSTAQGWRLVQIHRQVRIHHFSAEWYALGAHEIKDEWDAHGKPIRVRYKTILRRAFYAWFPTEFDAFNRSEGILPPYARWTVADFEAFTADRQRSGGCEPQGSEWNELRLRVPILNRMVPRPVPAFTYAVQQRWNTIKWD